MKEEQLKLQRARLEEDHLKHERILRKQQADRERLLGEQQRQIIALKKQQEMNSLLQTQPDELKTADPRLSKRQVVASSVEPEIEIPIASKIQGPKLVVKESNVQEIEIRATKMPLEIRPTLHGTPNDLPKLQVSSDKPPDTNVQASEELVKTSNVQGVIPMQSEDMTPEIVDSGERTAQAIDVTTKPIKIVVIDKNILVETELDSNCVDDIDNRKKKRVLELESKNNDSKMDTCEESDDVNKDGEKSIEPPPVKKIRSDEGVVDVAAVPEEEKMSVEVDCGEQSVKPVDASLVAEAVSGKPVEDQGKENRKTATSELKEGEARSRFRRPNRSEWRKLMIEKAKLERRQRIPSEKELPREMRVENHEDLLKKVVYLLGTVCHELRLYMN